MIASPDNNPMQAKNSLFNKFRQGQIKVINSQNQQQSQTPSSQD